jgi:penicillin-binding protein 1B
VRLVLGLISFAAGFFTAVEIVRLDRTVTQRFEGRLFRVPSRVFSAPTVLYPGIDAQHIELRGTLRRLGYREEIRQTSGGGPLERGRFVWGPTQIEVNLRPFEHPTRSEPGREVAIHLDDGVIQDIVDVRDGRSLAAVLLEPERVGAYYGPDREQRELVRLGEVPRHLIDAVLAVEDQRFEQHPGIDFRRIGGALLANLREGRVAQGGSTLTQQLVKNFFLTPERTLQRKLREAAMALVIELRYGKDAILESYLNEMAKLPVSTLEKPLGTCAWKSRLCWPRSFRARMRSRLSARRTEHFAAATSCCGSCTDRAGSTTPASRRQAPSRCASRPSRRIGARCGTSSTRCAGSSPTSTTPTC